ncbi:hypothetical protein HCH_07021 [Hahella chejuensis KCTC 2396]|uniref:Uncharacterized protein n=1 Tax=Hahella chejuensis (strain KCTC 2396) TaxID=349521 RepID=Q2S6T8_HAHCH|nr:hypothetical protein HCH_07021 [Hahella chejuensis KCTC 2396]
MYMFYSRIHVEIISAQALDKNYCLYSDYKNKL